VRQRGFLDTTRRGVMPLLAAAANGHESVTKQLLVL
jgi:hypothetical protein